MSNTKHTPGPWKKLNRPYNGANHVFENIITNDSGQLGIAFIDNSDADEQCEANAKLIAAAPELLKALEHLVFTASKLWDEVKVIKDTPSMTVSHPIIEDAKAAIKKATE